MQDGWWCVIIIVHDDSQHHLSFINISQHLTMFTGTAGTSWIEGRPWQQGRESESLVQEGKKNKTPPPVIWMLKNCISVCRVMVAWLVWLAPQGIMVRRETEACLATRVHLDPGEMRYWCFSCNTAQQHGAVCFSHCKNLPFCPGCDRSTWSHWPSGITWTLCKWRTCWMVIQTAFRVLKPKNLTSS